MELQKRLLSGFGSADKAKYDARIDVIVLDGQIDCDSELQFETHVFGVGHNDVDFVQSSRHQRCRLFLSVEEMN